MIRHQDIQRSDLHHKIKDGSIAWAGNRQLKIYGTLSCQSGKRMKIKNRVFFDSKQEAKDLGYRPCGHCLRAEYLRWKAQIQDAKSQ